MTERLEKELALLRAVFPDSEFHDVEGGWFHIQHYTVQFGGWTQSEVAVCFHVPDGYPGVNPYAFWVSPPLRLAGTNRRPVNDYLEPSRTPFPGIWGKFSWTPVDPWCPGAEPGSGSNLLNFVLSFRDRFRERP
jgi:Prokaryotic E2 family E